MTAEADEITRRQGRALDALVAGATLCAAAASAGVTERTLRRWRRDQRFAGALRKAQDQAFAEARRELRAASLDAVRALRSVASDSSSPAPARVSAAKCVVELALRSREVDDLAVRVEELEHLMPSNGQGRAL